MRLSTTPPLKKCPSTLLTSFEGLSCYLALAQGSVLGAGLRNSWRGEGREPRDGHLVFVFLFFCFFSLSLSLNKCHFLRQKEGTVNILDTLWGRLCPRRRLLPPQTLMHFPNLITSFLKAFLPQPNLQK